MTKYEMKVKYILENVNILYNKKNGSMTIDEIMYNLGLKSCSHVIVNEDGKTFKLYFNKNIIRNILIENRIEFINARTGKVLAFNKIPNIDIIPNKVFVLFGVKKCKSESYNEYVILRFISQYKKHYLVPRCIDIARETGVKLSEVKKIFIKHGLDKVDILIDGEIFKLCFGYRRIIRTLISSSIVKINDDNQLEIDYNVYNMTALLNNIRTKFIALFAIILNNKEK